MVKPYYATIIIAAACTVAFRRRDIWVLCLPEFRLWRHYGGVSVGSATLWYPAFFETLVPLLREYLTWHTAGHWTCCS